MSISDLLESTEAGRNNFEFFLEYYCLFMNSGDCDPAFPILNYICDRFELNTEQRFWIAFLYGTNYCAPTVYYIYNEFPDFENVSMSRIKKWWKSNKHKTLFQTDRAKVKNFDLFPKIIESYTNLMGNSQEDTISSCKTYESLYHLSSQIYYFGRFSIFNYTQALWELTNIKLEPTFFNLKDGKSCKNGLCYAFDKKRYIEKKNEKAIKIPYKELQKDLLILLQKSKKRFRDLPVNLWNIETCLCAYKKLFWGKRYLFYYVDRQQEEIAWLENRVREGVNWKPLWDFRKKFFDHTLLGELNGWNGIRKNRMNIFKNTRTFGNPKNIEYKYTRKINFPGTGKCYEIS